MKYARLGLYKSREITCGYCRKTFITHTPKRRFCTPECGVRNRVVPVETRFWRNVQKTDWCWLWTAGVTQKGYGVFGLSGHPASRAHRVAYILTHGEIPRGLCVLHRCDNPPCVNPAHLFLGTAKDNTADMIAKGREKFRNLGISNGRSKLTEAQVKAIKSDMRSGAVVAAEFSVSRSLVNRIRQAERIAP